VDTEKFEALKKNRQEHANLSEHLQALENREESAILWFGDKMGGDNKCLPELLPTNLSNILDSYEKAVRRRILALQAEFIRS
jgi:hypothetical protein